MGPIHTTPAPHAPGKLDTEAGNRASLASAAKLRRAWVWPGIVVALLATHAMVWIAFVTIAADDPSFSVEPDHYKKALTWDRTAAELRESQALGWRAEIVMEGPPSITAARRVVCRLVDRGGNPVAGAQVEVVTFHHARGAERATTTFAEESPGIYAAPIRMPRVGLWEYRITARRGPQAFHQVAYHEAHAESGDETWRH